MKRKNFEDEDNNSIHSDMSNYTDMKVFKGAYKKLSKMNKESLLRRDETELIRDINKKMKSNMNIKTFQNENGTKIENSEVPLSFRTTHNEDLEHRRLSSKKSSGKSSESPKFYAKTKSKKSKSNQPKVSRTSANDEVEIHNFEVELEVDDSRENNIFLNLRDTSTRNKSDIASMRKTESYSNKNSNRISSINSKFDYKTDSSSQISCTVSKIERGVAVLVSNDDSIFTLPLCFMPKKITLGNSYQITVDETAKAGKKASNVKTMQKKYIKSKK
jgi:hypothetical protein